MPLKTFVCFLLLLVAPTSVLAVDYYASTTGSGTTCSAGSPCSMSGGIAKLTPGDTLNVNDGTYTGSTGMVIVSGRNCTAALRCTIIAVNDGAVTIDGENARIPLDIVNSSYWTVSGLNVKRSSGSVCSIRSTTTTPPHPAGHHELKRTLCWDALVSANQHAINVSYITDVLIEDSGGFGTARYTMLPYKTNRITWRRCWGRWTSNTTGGPQATAHLSYNSYNVVWENCIFEWNRIGSASGMYGNLANPGGIEPSYASQTGLGFVSNWKVLGSIAYFLTGQTAGQSGLFWTSNSTGTAPNTCTLSACATGNTWQHSVALIQPSSQTFEPFELQDSMTGGTETADHLSAFRGTSGTASRFIGNYSCTNCLQQDTVGAYNLYTNTGAGATIRYRYVNGALTATPLWPFPMADRIAAALTAGGYASHNVNTVIQNLFGTFPSDPPPDPPPPGQLRQARYQWEAMFSSGSTPSRVPIHATTENVPGVVSPGGCARLRTKIAADSSVTSGVRGFVLYADRNGAASYGAVGDTFAGSPVNIKFAGAASTVDTGTTIPEIMTNEESGAVQGQIVSTASPIIQANMTASSDVELAWNVCVDDDTATTDYYEFKVRQVNLDTMAVTDLDAYTVIARLNIAPPSASGFAQVWDLLMLTMLPILGRIESQTTKPMSNLDVTQTMDQVMIDGANCTGLKTTGTGTKRTVTCLH